MEVIRSTVLTSNKARVIVDEDGVHRAGTAFYRRERDFPGSRDGRNESESDLYCAKFGKRNTRGQRGSERLRIKVEKVNAPCNSIFKPIGD